MKVYIYTWIVVIDSWKENAEEIHKGFNESFEEQFFSHTAEVITHQSYNSGIILMQFCESEQDLFKKTPTPLISVPFDSRCFSPAKTFLLWSQSSIKVLNDA